MIIVPQNAFTPIKVILFASIIHEVEDLFWYCGNTGEVHTLLIQG